MAAAATMEPHDRRLSVSKSSSSKIGKPSSAPRPSSSAASSRPPATVVSADLNNFRRVVQQLTGTLPPSASSLPVREHTRSSRLQRIAPPPLRDSMRPLHHHQDQQNCQFEQHHHQQVSNLHLLQQPHHHYDIRNSQPQHDFSWLSSSAGLLSPPLAYTQISNLNQNPDSNFNACNKPPSYPNPNPLPLSPNLFSALPPLTPSDSTWANPLHATPSPRPLSNSAGQLPPLLPLPSESGEDLRSGSSHSRSKAFEWLALSSPSSNGHPPLPSSSNGLPPSPNGHPLLPSSSNARPLLRSSSNGNPLLSSSSNEHSQFGPSPLNGHPPLPPSPASLPPLLPLSPSASFNPWLPPWSPSPFLPLPFSPGLCPPSPGFGPFINSSPRGFSFCATNDYPSKLP